MDERGEVSVILKTSLPEFGGIEIERSCILNGGGGGGGDAGMEMAFTEMGLGGK